MQMTFRNSHQLSGDVYSFEFEPERPVDYIAGQFAEFTIEHPTPDAKGIRRWFTISSNPSEPYITITIRCRTPLSSYKHALLGLQPGDHISVDSPMGDFVLPLDTSLPLAWIAGGIGITPFRSMASWMSAHHEQRDIRLIHSISNLDQLMFNDDFIKADISQLEVIDTSLDQRPDVETLLSKIPDAKQRLVYISGPESMVNTLRQGLLAADFDRNDIIVDQFLGYR